MSVNAVSVEYLERSALIARQWAEFQISLEKRINRIILESSVQESAVNTALDLCFVNRNKFAQSGMLGPMTESLMKIVKANQEIRDELNDFATELEEHAERLKDGRPI
jgi:hypothetical protein